jgi:hypothetical protein
MSGPFGSSQWMYASGGFYNGVATQSLRFNDGDSAYLTRTPSIAGNQKTWTWSGWVKRGNLGGTDTLLSVYDNSVGEILVYIDSNNQFSLYWNVVGVNSGSVTASNLLRDSSAHYHLLVVFDTTQGTASNRVKLYINGTLASLSASTYPNQNQDLLLNSTNEIRIGYAVYNNHPYDGYLSEVNFIDGLALDPTSFGEFKNGVWIPIEYTGSYGTNGFRLQFNQTGTGTASSSTIGADTSGNDHHFSSSGIVASDCDMPDSPENNFCTMNPLWYPAGTLSEGNLKFIPTVSSDTGTVSTFVPTGKSYWEVYIVSGSASSLYMGIVKTSAISNNYNTSSADWVFSQGSGAYRKYGTLTSGQTTWGASDILGLAYDTEATTLYVYKNNALISTITGLEDVEHYVLIAGNTTSEAMVANFGQDSSFAGNTTAGGNTDANGKGDFKYAPPSGYLALCTANLPEPTISPNADTQADDYFNTVLYTGDSSTSRALTGVGFQPDFVWIKSRSTANNHNLNDSVRGANKQLYSNLTDAETSQTNNLKSFDSDGFTLGSDGDVNFSPRTYVAWNWKAGGTAVSNTDGSITSSVSANTDAGFSIVTYTGTGSAVTVGHNLGAVPSMFIVKRRNGTSGWATYHKDLTSASYYIQVNDTGGESLGNNVWNQTDPTSSVFTVGTDLSVSSGTYVAYCFAEIEGYSKFGSYTGNGLSDGTFVYTGFRPAFIITKTSSHVSSWSIVDTTRDPFNIVNQYILAESSGAEGDFDSFDILSNGFKARTTNAERNGSGRTVIYMAFAEAPFKYANAR